MSYFNSKQGRISHGLRDAIDNVWHFFVSALGSQMTAQQVPRLQVVALQVAATIEVSILQVSRSIDTLNGSNFFKCF